MSANAQAQFNNHQRTLPVTKLYIPLPHDDLLLRTRLHHQLQSGLNRRFTLISAPAGSGKTTLLNVWCIRSRAERAIAWVSLDSFDNDPVRFWTYVAAAIDEAHPDESSQARALLESSLTPPINAALVELCNELAAVEQDCLLVLDDYHLIEEPQIHTDVLKFIEMMPPNAHVIISTRVDPPLPLARLRAHGLMAEVRIEDLRFTREEIADLLTQRLPISLSSEHVTALEASTEGWIAGLQLAMLSMQSNPDITSFITSLSGTHRHIADYLTEEVLRSQSPDVQRFLLQTAHLRSLCGPLCDAVTGQNNSQQMLEWLERANLFVVPLDDDRHWYRYHHLFADLLRKQQTQLYASSLPDLYQRAAAWSEAAGMVDNAIDYALEAQNYEAATRLIVHHAEGHLSRGELVTVRRWLQSMPPAARRQHPHLSLYYAWALLAAGQIDQVEDNLQAAEAVLDTTHHHLTKRELCTVHGEIAVVRGMLAMIIEQKPSFEFPARASELLPPDNWLIGLNQFNLGFAHLWRGDIKKADTALHAAIESSLKANNLYVAALAITMHGMFHGYWGELNEAEIMYRRGVASLGQERMKLPIAYLIKYVKGELDRERGDLQPARDLLEEVIENLTRMENPELVVEPHISLARSCFALGDHDSAFRVMDEIDAICDSPLVMTWSRVQVNSHYARLLIRAGRLDQAASRLNLALHSMDQIAHIIESSYVPFYRDYVVFTEVRLKLAQQRADEARILIEKHLNSVTGEIARATRIEAGILRTLALHAIESHSHRVYRTLAETLAIAQPHRFVRLLADEGPVVGEILQHIPRKLLEQYDLSADYVRQLVEASGYQATDTQLTDPQAALVEPLSERELEVLRLIADGYGNQQIAEELYLSLSTVKWHLSNIYGKLGVNKRVQAISRARELKLI